VWDGVYTEAQAERGKAAYTQSCVFCHGPELAGTGEAKPLAGPEFLSSWNGLSVGELLDRVLPAFDRWLARTDWQCGLLVLHGGVNRALISTALAGRRAFFGRIEQAPACINVLDIGADDLVLRAVNLTPTQWLHQRERHTTMEKLLAQFTGGAA
jgi:broad specificity phosphatase PhoE